jgi:hypothetical protein
MVLQPIAVAPRVEYARVSVGEEPPVAQNGPYPTLTLLPVEEVWK